MTSRVRTARPMKTEKITLNIIIILYALLKEYHCVDTYDYIIVGGGSAGAALANRLSEDSSTKILLIEAGDHPPRNSEIPLLLDIYGQKTSINWNYTIERQDSYCRGAINNTCPYYMGRTLGGTSQINYMLYTRGSKIDYDRWAENGAAGWSYKDVLPYFIKAEKVTIQDKIIEKKFHGTKGPLTVSLSPYSTPLKDAYLEAVKEFNYSILDYNGKRQEGFYESQLTERDGYRCSTEKAYLQPAYARRNLIIITNALVTKVNFDHSKRATGVTYLKDGGYVTVNARKEVILSAGAIKSPQLLLLSGIGPKKDLKKMKIDVIADLPVGLNLQDHVQSAVVYRLNKSVSGIPTFSDIISNISQTEFEYPKKLTGILSSPNVLEVFGYIKTIYEKVEGDFNDIQFFFLSNFAVQQFYSPEIVAIIKPYFNTSGFLITPALLHPKSRGQVKLRSTNPEDPPIIQMNYFSHPDDIKVLVYGLKKAMEFAETKALSKFEPIPLGPIPGCENFTDFKSDAFLECIIRVFTISTYHASGTCKMGNNSLAVVDSNLSVRGVTGLRVVDASIMPTIPSANTNAATIMIGEKGADIIKKNKAVQ